MQIKKYFLKITYYLLINFALFSIIGAFLYKIYELNNLSIILTIILTEIIIFILPYIIKRFNFKFENFFSNTSSQKSAFNFLIKNKKEKIKKYFLFSSYLVFFLIEIIILLKSKTGDVIISPWEKISPLFLFLFFILNLNLFLNIYFKKPASLFLISLHFFLSFSIIAFIYKIGYGFDFFIHNASLNIIKEKGILNPKPFYYLGHYSLIIILNRITFIPISVLNKFLVPFLASIYFPFFLFYFTEKWLEKKKIILFCIPLFLIFPFSFFTISNPQNLAYFYLFLSILSGLKSENKSSLSLVYLFSLATFSVHPLAGIPAIFYALLLSVYYSKSKFKKYFYRILLSLNTLALPIAFLISKSASLKNQIPSSFKESIKKYIFSLLSFKNPHSENIVFNFIYFYIFNLKFIFGAIFILGLFLAWKYKKNCSFIFLNFYLSISLLLSSLIIRNMHFNNLIIYEQNDFKQRIIKIALFFLLPFLFLAFYHFIEKLLKEKKAIQYIFFIFLGIIISFSLYSSYPRLDPYYNSHGYSVGKSDLEASKWINNNEKEYNYIVLANQEVSAAALKQFGFKKYFKNNIFYYPIPTGGKLYEHYLAMLKNPNKKTAQKAANLAGVKNVYFVLNKYWWASDKIKKEAELEADSFKIIEDKIYIFKYSF